VNVLKSIVALVLVATYLLGFGHSLLPHCETHCANEQHELAHDHEHHNHAEDDVSHADHDHIAHADHFDEDWIDFLYCFLTELEHHSNSCNSVHFLQDTELRKRLSDEERESTIDLVALQSTSNTDFDIAHNTKLLLEDTVDRQRILQNTLPLRRGPPLLS